jgi:hypothetical protein
VAVVNMTFQIKACYETAVCVLCTTCCAHSAQVPWAALETEHATKEVWLPLGATCDEGCLRLVSTPKYVPAPIRAFPLPNAGR